MSYPCAYVGLILLIKHAFDVAGAMLAPPFVLSPHSVSSFRSDKQAKIRHGPHCPSLHCGLSVALIGWVIMVITSRIERQRQERHMKVSADHRTRPKK
jgi:hypothetical protein